MLPLMRFCRKEKSIPRFNFSTVAQVRARLGRFVRVIPRVLTSPSQVMVMAPLLDVALLMVAWVAPALMLREPF